MKLRNPDNVILYFDEKKELLSSPFQCENGYARFEESEGGLKVFATAKNGGLSFVRLRWNEKMRKDVKILGDAMHSLMK